MCITDSPCTHTQDRNRPSLSQVHSTASFVETSPVILSSCTQTWQRSRFVGTADSRRRFKCFTMTEPLDAELLKDLRGWGMPPSFDGNDADYQEIRFSFRIHMRLVSTVSHALMDKCKAGTKSDHLGRTERAGRNTFEAFITKGSVRICGRIRRSRGMASDTQQRRSRHRIVSTL